MGTPGKAYHVCQTPSGFANRLELAPIGPTVNDDNITNLDGLTSVVGLDLSESRISDVGLKVVAGLKDIEYLQLAQTNVTDDGLLTLSTLTKVEAIDLTGTKVTQAGAEHLKRLPALKFICSAGTTLVSVDGCIVDNTVKTDSWLGIKHNVHWHTRGWSIVSSKFQVANEKKGEN
jgi:hypothetical protein